MEGGPGANVRGRFHQLPDVRHGRRQLLQTGDTEEERIRGGWFRAGTGRYERRPHPEAFRGGSAIFFGPGNINQRGPLS